MYVSTRGKDKASASKAILKGLADDGGLFIFEKLPDLNINSDWVNYSYKEVAKKVLLAFLDDFNEEEIDYCINNAYNDLNFIPDMVSYDKTKEFAFLNLYNGPTFAFKDMALTILPYLVDVSKKKNNVKEKTVVLTATSGDTGSAALSGFKQIENNNVIVLYPNNAVSKIQEAQMQSFKAVNAFPIAVNGNFDDCQRAVKEAFNTFKFDGISLSSANSINIGRLIPQVVYYIYSYMFIVKSGAINYGDEINVSVPTGNFGNILAAYISKLCGVKYKKIICASNENNVLTDFFNTGVYDANREFKKTNSPSMDILVSSNLERLLYLISKDSNYVESLMLDLNKYKKYEFDKKYVDKLDVFLASYVNEHETVDAINECFKDYGILIDPHTSVAYKAYKNVYNELKGYTLIVSTASPYKFSDTIIDALNIESSNDEFMNIKLIEKKSGLKVDKRINELATVKFDKEVWDKNDILSNLKRKIGEF